MTRENYVPQIYMYDPMAFDGDGSIAMAVGDLDTAANVATITPGLTSDAGSAPGLADDALHVQQAASFESKGGSSNATMFWIGYDAPDDGDSPGVVSEGMAKAGGERLADTLDGLNAMRSDDFHLTAIGHSYGSTTVGHAMTDHHPDVDDVVLLGSPGAGTPPIPPMTSASTRAMSSSVPTVMTRLPSWASLAGSAHRPLAPGLSSALEQAPSRNSSELD
jgi:hypothetical protein